jgi:hypothetical protein
MTKEKRDDIRSTVHVTTKVHKALHDGKSLYTVALISSVLYQVGASGPVALLGVGKARKSERGV